MHDDWCAPGFSPIERFHHSFEDFLVALQVLTKDPHEICEEYGSFNVAWELQLDILQFHEALMHLPDYLLAPDVRDEVLAFIEEVDNLPEHVLVGVAPVAEQVRSMQDPAWWHIRRRAPKLGELLRPAIRVHQRLLNYPDPD